MIPFKTRIKSGVVQRLEVIESLSFQGQELTPGAATDEKAKISANDTTAGYLNGKLVAGSGIVLTENNNGGNETLTISANAVDLDVKVSVSANDTTAGYLNGKLVAGTGIVFTENNNGGDETLTLTLGSHTHAASDITSGIIATARLATGTANSTTYLRGDQTWQTITGGVAGFTGSQNATSPNNTVNASRLLVDAVSTNADAVIQPKGTGSLLAQLPDSTATGGNKRGINAVDLQTIRNSASHVASGNYAVITGGNQNTASSAYAIVAGGYQNAATNQYANIVGGFGNNCLGYSGTIVGGESAFIGSGASYCGIFAGSGQALSSTNYSVAVGGNNNSISGGDHNGIMGGSFNTISTGSNRNAIVGGFNNSIPFYGHKAVILGGEYAMAYQSNTVYLGTSGNANNAGTHQMMWTVLGITTSSSASLLRDSQNNQKGFALRQSTVAFLRLTLVSVSSNGAKTAVQKFEGSFKRDNANTISLLFFSAATVVQNSFTSAPTLSYSQGLINASNPEHYGIDFIVTNNEAISTRHSLMIEAVIATF